jgi:hypothetical protein
MFSSWLLVRALDARPPRALPWMLYMLVALAFAYTHYCALFTLFAQALFALAYLLYGVREDVTAVLKEPNFRWFTLAYVGVAAGWAPWLPIFLAQRERVADSWYTAPFSLQDVPAMCYEMFFHTGSQGGAWSHALIVAGLCAFVLLALLWKGGAGQWCTALLAVVPFALISLVSYASSNLMIVRYMAFLQPFILIALAAVLWRIAIGALREVVAYIVVSAALLLHVDFVDSLQIANRPGARAAAAYIDARRAPGEPAIACSPLLMFPTKFHSCNREGWHVYSDRREIPYYAGGSLITDGDIFYEADMDAVRAKRAWVITTSGNWARWALYIPPKWVRTAEQRFEEVYSFQNDVVVICYFTE